MWVSIGFDNKSTLLQYNRRLDSAIKKGGQRTLTVTDLPYARQTFYLYALRRPPSWVIITIYLIRLYSAVEDGFLKKLHIFIIWLILSHPSTRTSGVMNVGIHHYYILGLSDLFQGETVVNFEEVMHFYYMTDINTPYHRNPYVTGVMKSTFFIDLSLLIINICSFRLIYAYF